jgi:hypothetical protein
MTRRGCLEPPQPRSARAERAANRIGDPHQDPSPPDCGRARSLPLAQLAPGRFIPIIEPGDETRGCSGWRGFRGVTILVRRIWTAQEVAATPSPARTRGFLLPVRRIAPLRARGVPRAVRVARIKLLAALEEPPKSTPAAQGKSGIRRYRFWRGAAGAGVPVVAGASSGIQVIALRSYLNPLALLSASFVEFITR